MSVYLGGVIGGALAASVGGITVMICLLVEEKVYNAINVSGSTITSIHNNILTAFELLGLGIMVCGAGVIIASLFGFIGPPKK